MSSDRAPLDVAVNATGHSDQALRAYVAEHFDGGRNAARLGQILEEASAMDSRQTDCR